MGTPFGTLFGFFWNGMALKCAVKPPMEWKLSYRPGQEVEARSDRAGFGDAPNERSGGCIHAQYDHAKRSDRATYALSKRARFCIGRGYRRQSDHRQDSRHG